VLPDEHTWPITFSYAIGGASGKAGLRASLFFSLAFTAQRALLSEVAYLALAPFLLSPTVNGFVFAVVGLAMAAAGAIILRRNRYSHFHALGHHHAEAREMETGASVLGRTHRAAAEPKSSPPPTEWTLIHGFIAGFGFEGFSIFINTIAAPAMGSAWLGFLPGLVFGLGTTLTLLLIGYLFGASLRWTRRLSESEIRRIGAQTGGRTLFFGGLLFAIAGGVALSGLDRRLAVDTGPVLITVFMTVIAVPAFVYSVRETLAARRAAGP
jgi:sulfite exporter TauE/SafE